jgi:hypothetical protein
VKIVKIPGMKSQAYQAAKASGKILEFFRRYHRSAVLVDRKRWDKMTS